MATTWVMGSKRSFKLTPKDEILAMSIFRGSSCSQVDSAAVCHTGRHRNHSSEGDVPQEEALDLATMNATILEFPLALQWQWIRLLQACSSGSEELSILSFFVLSKDSLGSRVMKHVHEGNNVLTQLQQKPWSNWRYTVFAGCWWNAGCSHSLLLLKVTQGLIHNLEKWLIMVVMTDKW